MKKRHARLSALLLTGAMALSLAACSGSGGGNPSGGSGDPAPAGDTIKVGALFNVTGGQASLDEPSLRGFQLYFDQLNEAGGVNGRQVEVVSYDGKTDQSTCATNRGPYRSTVRPGN